MTSIGRNAATVLAAAALLSGCAVAKNTLAQDLARQRWEVCEGRFPTVMLKESHELWYSPVVMNMIRDRVALRADGFRERELIEYRAK